MIFEKKKNSRYMYRRTKAEIAERLGHPAARANCRRDRGDDVLVLEHRAIRVSGFRR